ncbi:hypothetical protein Ancab_023520 [Ancistrocladus abbreviatus]
MLGSSYAIHGGHGCINELSANGIQGARHTLTYLSLSHHHHHLLLLLHVCKNIYIHICTYMLLIMHVMHYTFLQKVIERQSKCMDMYMEKQHRLGEREGERMDEERNMKRKKWDGQRPSIHTEAQ